MRFTTDCMSMLFLNSFSCEGTELLAGGLVKKSTERGNALMCKR